MYSLILYTFSVLYSAIHPFILCSHLVLQTLVGSSWRGPRKTDHHSHAYRRAPSARFELTKMILDCWRKSVNLLTWRKPKYINKATSKLYIEEPQATGRPAFDIDSQVPCSQQDGSSFQDSSQVLKVSRWHVWIRQMQCVHSPSVCLKGLLSLNVFHSPLFIFLEHETSRLATSA